jgi:uncharacterized protein (TIGR00730 family)
MGAEIQKPPAQPWAWLDEIFTMAEFFTEPTSPATEVDHVGPDWGVGRGVAETTKFFQGPQPRSFELGQACKIFLELVKGFRAFHFLGPCATVFGSARFTPEHRYYKLAREVGSALSRAGFTVMTGGGPGIMEAANRGAKDAGGLSVGCNIELQHEQQHNPYLDRWITFQHFYIRKTMLIKYSYGFVAMPGGYGTLDEIFETVTLIQTQKIQNFPLVLVGVDYWQPMIDFLRNRMIPEKTIDPIDVDRILLTDSPAQASDFIATIGMKQFGLTYGKRPRRRWWLLE